MHINDSLVSGLVELPQLLSSGSLGGLVEVRVESAPGSSDLTANTQLVVNGLGLLRGVEPRIEILEGLREPVMLY